MFTFAVVKRLYHYNYLFLLFVFYFFLLSPSTIEHRGKILATGQVIRFAGAAFAGILQTFLLNGPTTNSPETVYNVSNTLIKV